MKRPFNETDIKKALEYMIESYGLSDKLRETRIKEAYKACMGPYILKNTKSIKFSKHKLTLNIESSVIRNEINMVKTAIIQKINQELRENIVRELDVY
jgi:hypothetical protein